MSVRVLPGTLDWRVQQADLLETKAARYDDGLELLDEWEQMLPAGDENSRHALRAVAAVLREHRNDWVDQAAVLRAELQESRTEQGLRTVE